MYLIRRPCEPARSRLDQLHRCYWHLWFCTFLTRPTCASACHELPACPVETGRPRLSKNTSKGIIRYLGVYCLSFVICPLSVVSCPLSVVRCQLSVVSCPLSVVRCQLSVVSCPL